MKPFKKNTSYKPGGFSNKGEKSWGQRKETFDATCADCSRRCQVPFRPNGRKPVLCSDCFRSSGGGEERSYDRRPARHDRFESKPFRSAPREDNSEVLKQMRLLNEKMDQIIEALVEFGEDEM